MTMFNTARGIKTEEQAKRLAEAAAYIFHGFPWTEHVNKHFAWIDVYNKLKAVHPEAFRAKDYELDREVKLGFNPVYAGEARDRIMTCLTWSVQPEHEPVTYWCHVYNALDDIFIKAGVKTETDPFVDHDSVHEFTPPSPKPVKRRGYRTPVHEVVMAKLERLGYRRLGSGCYSVVFLHDDDPDYVIKVNTRPDDWPAYVKWGQENGFAGKFTPEVIALKVFKSGCYVAKVRRYKTEIANVDYGEMMRDLYAETKAMCRRRRRDEDEDSNIFYAAANKAKRDLMETVSPGVTEFAERFREDWSADATDLHDGNWMVSFDNRLILTDPVTSAGRMGTSKRERDEHRIKSGARVFAVAA